MIPSCSANTSSSSVSSCQPWTSSGSSRGSASVLDSRRDAALRCASLPAPVSFEPRSKAAETRSLSGKSSTLVSTSVPETRALTSTARVWVARKRWISQSAATSHDSGSTYPRIAARACSWWQSSSAAAPPSSPPASRM